MGIIADSKVTQFGFHAKTKMFVEITIARVNGRGAMFRRVTSRTDNPSGELSLADPPEAGMDQDHKKFISDFIAYLGEMIVSDLRDQDESETVKAINAELDAQFEVEGWQYYYVFENPTHEAERRKRHELAMKLDEMFPPHRIHWPRSRRGISRRAGHRFQNDENPLPRRRNRV